MIRIRVDDFPQTKGEPQHTLSAFREFNRELTALTGKRYLLGVIPKRCSIDDILFLRNETDCVIGLHGIDHDESKLDLYGNEFPPYMSKFEIRRSLLEAKEGLEAGVGRSVRIYMPPRNRIDMRTASVLPECRFEAFTAGPETEWRIIDVYSTSKDRMVGWPDVKLLMSHQPDEYGRSDELFMRNSHENLLNHSKKGESVILTLHWTWECNLGNGFSSLRRFLERLNGCFEDFDCMS